MRSNRLYSLALLLGACACTLTAPAVPTAVLPPPTSTASAQTSTLTAPAATGTPSFTPTASVTATLAPSDTPAPPATNTSPPVVEQLEATVTADRLSCRYGPGPEYLYLFAFRAGARINLVGRVDATNWNWVMVENDVPCWVRADFLAVQGDILSLPVVYPGIARLPITPYYRGSEVLNAQRNPQTNEITITWVEVPVNLGDYEDESMQTYIIELWRCQGGERIFDPLATRVAFITFIDEPGCSEPSYGRIWVQDKHGFAGPAEIPWPPYDSP